MERILTDPRKRTVLWLELLIAATTGSEMKKSFRALEGDGFEYVTGYDVIVRAQQNLKDPITADVKEKIKLIAAEAPRACPQQHDTAAPAAPAAREVQDERLAALLSASPISDVHVSVSKDFWNWDGEAPQERFKGKVTRWTNKEEGKICVHWEDAAQGKTENLLDQGDIQHALCVH